MEAKTIGVFMGSQNGKTPIFHEIAVAVGQKLAENNYNLVYGGSASGLMGTVAKSAKEAGAYVTGIHPDGIIPEQAGPDLADDYIRVPDMDTRKRMMFDQADAFLFLPGGMGTLEELGQVLSWTKLGIYDKPIVVLNVEGYYDGLSSWIEKSAHENFEAFHDLENLSIIADLDIAFTHFNNKLKK